MNVEKLYKFLLTIIVIMTMIYIIGLGYINQHEFVHRQIYSRYGVDSYTVINPRTVSAATYITSNNVPDCNDYCKLQHGINDAVGYNTAVFIFNSWALFITFLIYRGLTKKKEKQVNGDSIH